MHFLRYSIFLIVYTTITLSHDLINIKKLLPTAIFDIRYATTNNFTKTKIYTIDACYLHKHAAHALKKVVDELNAVGLSVKIFDAYRPLSAQWKLWNAFPVIGYVADPRKGGKHTRGTAVDLTLINISDGSELTMPTEFDSFEEKAWADYKDLPEKVLANRNKLQSIMRKHGFMTIKKEWWHFDFKEYLKYPSLDIAFEALQ